MKNMRGFKNFIGYAFAGVIGASMVLGVSTLTNHHTKNSLSLGAFPSKVKAISTSAKDDRASLYSIAPLSFNSAAIAATPAVVKIKTLQTEQKEAQGRNPFGFLYGDADPFSPRVGAGSGVIITADGYIVTNNHVIEGGDEFKVTLNDRRTFKATKVGSDARVDLAVLKIEAQDLPTLSYANSDELKIGDWVLAIGNPFEYLTSTVTAGIVSAKGRDIDIINNNLENIESFIQTDAAVNQGNSGGALVNTQGELVGINTAIATQTGTFSGYSFAIPVNLMKKIVEDLIQFGSYKRAMLGVAIAPLTETMAAEYGVAMDAGIEVSTITAGGAAALAGILPKDVITHVDGRQLHSVPQIQELIGGKRVGDVVVLEIVRKGKRKDISVRLKEKKE